MHLPLDAQGGSVSTSITEAAGRAIAFGNCMAEHAEERKSQREQILAAVKETTLSSQWRKAPGVNAAVATRISQEEGPLAFATVELIERHPELQDYYREQAGIPTKRIRQQVKGRTREEKTRAWVEFVNSVCTRIVQANDGWDASYHERLAASCRSVSMDGTMRNRIGQDAEEKVEARLVEWLERKGLISEEANGKEYRLTSNVTLKFASEPDIGFYRGFVVKTDKLIAVVEIKGGKDPAGALERIGAIEKSMNETPDECWRFAILGVTTQAMEERLAKLRLSDRFDLDRLLANENGEWDRFTTRLFKDALRMEYG